MLLFQAGRALRDHKLRSVLSTLGIIFAVVAVVAMLAVAEGARRTSLEQIGELGARQVVVRGLGLTAGQRAAAQERHSPGLTAADADALGREIQGLEAVGVLREVPALAGDIPPEEHLAVLAVSAGYGGVAGLAAREGRLLAAADVEQRGQVCVLGGDAARLLGARGRVGEVLRLEDRLYRIVGILRDGPRAQGAVAAVSSRDHRRSIVVPLGSEPEVQTADSTPEAAAVTEIRVQALPGADVEAAAAAVRAAVTRRHEGVTDFEVVVPRELLRQTQRTQRIFNGVLGSIAGISLLVGGIGIANIMLASVAERRREIGIRRAVGASRHDIALQFLAEAVLLTGSGGFLGALAGAGGAWLVTAFAGWRTDLTWQSFVLALAMATATGVWAGILPALRAARLDPVDAMRTD